MSISSGLFNNTLTLQNLTESDDGAGGVTQTWSDFGSFKARISPISSQERMLQNKTTQTTTHKIYCNNMLVTTANRVKWGDIYFEIVGITNPSEAYDHLEIDAREIFEGS